MLKFAEFCIALFFIFFLFFPEAEGLFFFFLPLPPLYFTVSCVVKVQFITDGELSFLAQVYVHSAVTRFVSFFFFSMSASRNGGPLSGQPNKHY